MARRYLSQPMSRARRAGLSQVVAGSRSANRRATQVTLVSRAAFCTLAGITESQLTLWEHEQLIAPVESAKPETLYAASSLRRARIIRTLAEELDVNLPGIDVILHLLDQLTR